jgi:hypothetical protein
MSSFTETRLADLSNVIAISRGIPTQATASVGELPVLSVTDLRLGSAARRFVDAEVLDDYDLWTPEAGDVLLSIEGGAVGETLVLGEGVAPFVPSQQVAIIHVLDETDLDAWYLGAWLATEPAREQLRRLARGSTIQRIPIKELQTLVIPMPPLEIQRDLGERFLAFETAINAHGAIVTCLEQLRALDLAVAFAEITGPHTSSHDTGRRGRAQDAIRSSETPKQNPPN